MTSRLRELEADLEATKGYSIERRDMAALGQQFHSKIAGYRMALEDVKPVLDAARKFIETGDEDDYFAFEASLARLEEHDD